MNEQGFRRDKVNQFSALSRVFDFCFIPLTLLLILKFKQQELSQTYVVLSLIYASSFLLFSETIQLYRYWSKNKVMVQLIYTVISALIAIACVTTFLFFNKSGQDVSRVAIGLWFVITSLGVTTWRIALKIIVNYFRTSIFHTKKIAIIGLTTSGIELAAVLNNNPAKGYELVAIYDDRTIERLPEEFANKLQGGVNQGVDSAKAGQFDVVYIALPSIAQNRIADILKKLGKTTVDVRILPSYLSYSLLGAQVSCIGNIETLSINESPHQGGSLIAKRLLYP